MHTKRSRGTRAFAAGGGTTAGAGSMDLGGGPAGRITVPNCTVGLTCRTRQTIHAHRGPCGIGACAGAVIEVRSRNTVRSSPTARSSSSGLSRRTASQPCPHALLKSKDSALELDDPARQILDHHQQAIARHQVRSLALVLSAATARSDTTVQSGFTARSHASALSLGTARSGAATALSCLTARSYLSVLSHAPVRSLTTAHSRSTIHILSYGSLS